jgi:antitoxin (DNA-binding transcriptional repressor) of toxin-antitoxin stability system
MKRYTAAELRKNLAQALDEVERGKPVMIERRRRRFRIIAEPTEKRAVRVEPIFRLSDPNLLETGWRWSWTPKGLALRVRRRRRSR